MLYEGHKKKDYPDFLDELESYEGEISDELARILTYKYLRTNLSYTVKLLTGVELYPLQEICLKAMFNREDVFCVWGRGSGKSFLLAMFAVLYAIFVPGIQIGILSNNFRRSKELFKLIEGFAEGAKGVFLRQCFVGNAKHGNDVCYTKIGTSEIYALPMGSDKIRGFRFQCVLLDEAGFISKQMIDDIIRPFMSTNVNPIERLKIKKAEDKMIAEGKIKAEERTEFVDPKFVMYSSASYRFEYLYELYENYKTMITKADKNTKSLSCILQFSYDAFPEGLYSEANIEAARQTMSTAQFDKEYRAIFIEDSGGYFSMKKMQLCTVPVGDRPTVEIKGDPRAKYILSIDPSFADSETSDNFAMALLKITPDSKTPYLVHSYAVAGGDLKDHIVYLHYLLSNFNIVYTIIDAGGGRGFIQAANESTTFQKTPNLMLSFFDADFEQEDYFKGVRASKRDYNLSSMKICHIQTFHPKWIRNANEYLQASFDHRRIMFAAPVRNDEDLNAAMAQDIPISKLKYRSEEKEELGPSQKKLDLIDWQGDLIDITKEECSIIEVTITDIGHQRFVLPQAVKRSDSADKRRKDNYTTLILGVWGFKCYTDMNSDEAVTTSSFSPRFIG